MKRAKSFFKRLSVILFILIFESYGIDLFSQTTKVSLSKGSFTIEKLLSEIEAKTNYLFVYNKQDVDLNRTVSIKLENGSVADILKKMFEGTGITFILDGNNIVLTKSKGGSNASGNDKMTVTGTVEDEKGNPLPGAGIIVKGPGTAEGCTTDMNGKFVLSNVPKGSELEISYIGYLSKVVGLSENPLIIVLHENVNALEQIMVIGYATDSKRNISGAVECVNKNDMNKGVIVSLADALKGKVAGVVISKSGGDPMGTTYIRIRGTTSLSGGNTPLIIIDGVFGDLNTLNSLSADDIQSVTILKDASETAQYGSRGAAGVIVVTTTKGRSGVSEIAYEGSAGISSVFKNLSMMSASEYRSQAKSLGFPYTDMGGNTDWLEKVERATGVTQNHHISFTSGSDISNMRASIGVVQEQGAVRNSKMTNYTAKFDAMQYAFNKKMKLELGSFASERDGTLLYDTYRFFYSAAAYNPTYPDTRNSDGEWDEDLAANEIYNPLGQLDITDKEGRNSINTHGKVTLQIIDGLKLSAFGSYTYNDSETKYYIPNNIRQGEINGNGVANIQNTIDKSLMGHVQLDYSKDFGRHHIDALALMEGQKYKTFYHGERCTGFETNYFKYNNLQAGANISWGNAWSNYSDYTIASYMARLNYVYDDKYIVTGNLRYDGSSKLGNGNKWGFFPSASLGWLVSNEKFMKDIKWIDNMKIRAGYGVTGNQDAIAPYNSLELYNPGGTTSMNGSATTVYGVTSNSNPDLKWEVKRMFDIGLDFSAFGNRLNLMADYYHSKTKDLLYDYTVPVPPFTYTTLLANIGSMTNDGFEFSVGGDIVRTDDFTFNASLNMSFQKNKLISLNGTYKGEALTTSKHIGVADAYAAGLTSNNNVTYLIADHSIGVFYLPHCTGIDENGQYILEDLDGNGSVDTGDSGDRYIAGNSIPKSYLGMNLSFKYKHWDLQTQFNGAFGFKIYDGTGMTYSNYSNFPTYNLLSSAKNENGGKGIYDIQVSDYWLKKGDYLNFEYASLGYTFDTKKSGIGHIVKNIRLGLSVNNICTITGYPGLTPMINSAGLSETLGVDDKDIYPLVRTFLFSLSVKF
ncbi:MAG: SusC/RagA family TonB-linked outer membrane protein [Bacteroidales bacterium]|jgi:TonB-linked SusC/RagA family outer membrane protein|nr:SusC/RagA family TonB-linked outer membrane protein [Bacteroidales bacterium]